jgi:hypothetical protein
VQSANFGEVDKQSSLEFAVQRMSAQLYNAPMAVPHWRAHWAQWHESSYPRRERVNARSQEYPRVESTDVAKWRDFGTGMLGPIAVAGIGADCDLHCELDERPCRLATCLGSRDRLAAHGREPAGVEGFAAADAPRLHRAADAAVRQDLSPLMRGARLRRARRPALPLLAR